MFGPLRAWPAGLLLSGQEVLEPRVIQHRFGQQALELVVLLLQLLQALRFGDRHPAEFRLPVVLGRFRDAVLAAQLRCLQACLGFLQHANNLFFGKSLLHDRSSWERTLHCQRTNRGEQVISSLLPLKLHLLRLHSVGQPQPRKHLANFLLSGKPTANLHLAILLLEN